jgi:transketolase
MRYAFLETLGVLMREHRDIIALTADMGFSVFEDLQKQFPTRFINTGVTEQSTVGIATGLALSGFKVYFYAQAPFATMRCFEQIRLDVAYNNVNVKIVGVAAGFSSNQLGISHFAVEDVALMRLLPNMTIFTPGDPYESKWATKQAYILKGPAYIRLTKSGSPVVHRDNPVIKVGKGLSVCVGRDITIFVSGSLLPMGQVITMSLLKVGIHAALISMPTIKPIDKDLILKEAKRTGKIVTLEEHSVIGGLGSIVAEVIAEEGLAVKFYRFGVPDKFTAVTGSPEYLLQYNGLSVARITNSILNLVKK